MLRKTYKTVSVHSTVLHYVSVSRGWGFEPSSGNSVVSLSSPSLLPTLSTRLPSFQGGELSALSFGWEDYQVSRLLQGICKWKAATAAKDTALAHVCCSSTGVVLQLGRLAPTCCCWLSLEKSARLFRGRQGYWENRECMQPEDDFAFHCLVDTNVLRHRIVVFVISGYDYIQIGKDWYTRRFHSSTEWLLGAREWHRSRTTEFLFKPQLPLSCK